MFKTMARLLWLLAVPAVIEAASALASPHPPLVRPLLVPTHPVTVDYIVTTADAGTLDARVAILAGGKRLRVTSPELPTLFLVDRTAGIAEVVLPVLRAYSHIDIRRYDPEQNLLAGAVFTRRGQAKIAGRACVQWQAVSRQGNAEACITADGVILQGKVTSARRGEVAQIIASAVMDRAPPPEDFDIPEGFSESPFQLDPKGFGR